MTMFCDCGNPEAHRRTLLALGRAVDAEAAHAALVADLRALRARSGYVLAADVLALLDRHAPMAGETP